MYTGKEIVYILKNLVKEVHELNRTLGRMSRASIFSPPIILKNTLDDTKETSDSQ